MNKEECEMALNEISNVLKNNNFCALFNSTEILRKIIDEHFKLVEEHEIMKQKYDHALEILEEKTVVPKRFWREWL